jgi:hypothetical protein
VLTIFTTYKPFNDRFAAPQWNALTSWLLMEPKPDVILFGDELGTETVARELRVRQIPHVARDEFGLPMLDFMFDRAQLLSRNDLMAWVNSDILLVEGFSEAVHLTAAHLNEFLMVGRRTEVALDYRLDFMADWRRRAKHLATQGELYTPCSSDYFAFRRPLSWTLPPFVAGRPRWDNWMMWAACDAGVPVVDATGAVMALHPRHGFGESGTATYKQFHKGESSQHNKALIREDQKYCLKHVRQAGGLWQITHEGNLVKVD